MTCRILLLAPLCLAIVLTAETARSGDKKEQEKLQGTWSMVKWSGGKPRPKKDKDLELTFKGDKVTIKSGAEPEAGEGTYSVDPTKKPKELNMHSELTSGKKVTNYAIYELNGDTLKICTFDGDKKFQSRPKQIVASEETILVVLKRDKRK
jgi:uncharacterized protein (TIGR03067 family)